MKIQQTSMKQNRDKLLKLLTKTKNTIPLLTNENLLETKTKTEIKKITSRINKLTEEFQKISYESETIEEEEQKNRRC